MHATKAARVESYRPSAVFLTARPGRSPGLWDRAYRLPVSKRPQWQCLDADSKASGVGHSSIRPRTLTVAGAAEALAGLQARSRTSFPFHPSENKTLGHLERACKLYNTNYFITNDAPMKNCFGSIIHCVLEIISTNIRLVGSLLAWGILMLWRSAAIGSWNSMLATQ